jgi:hypothetical protein
MILTIKIKAELDRINELEDPVQQGYEAAPILCVLHGLGAKALKDGILRHPSPDADNALRDSGVINWCNEQLEKQQ